METMQFKTNINCNGCVAKVTPFISQEKNIKSWMVDVKNADKILTVESDNLSSHEVSLLITKAGFNAEPIHKVSAHHISKSEKPSFWNDKQVWGKASKNTLNCLIGCTIGDFAMIMYLQTYFHHINMFLMMGLAMASGIATSILLETVILKFREKFVWKLAFQTAVGMSLLSMITMELAENITDLSLTGGNIPVSDPMYWYALIPSIAAGFIVPLPYNYYKLKKHGKACH
ncbi:MAG: DUF4396 domain-containing protein [Cytophagales bacterium]